MDGYRKITVTVPVRDLTAAQEFTNEGISETVRIALRLQAQELIRRRQPVTAGTPKIEKK